MVSCFLAWPKTPPDSDFFVGNFCLTLKQTASCDFVSFWTRPLLGQLEFVALWLFFGTREHYADNQTTESKSRQEISSWLENVHSKQLVSILIDHASI